jgi:signal transduction histidine kinase
MCPISIKTKLIVAVSALLSLVLVATSATLFRYYERTTKDQVAEAQLALATLVANDIDAQLMHAHAELVEVARILDPELLRGTPATQAFLDRQLRILGFFTAGMYLFDARGTLVAEVPQFNRRGQDFAYREYLATTLSTRRPHIGAPYASTRPGSPPTVMMTAPIFDARGELVGVLGGAVDLLADSVLGRTVRIRSGKTGYFFVFDRDRTMILHRDPERIMKKDIPPGANKLLDAALTGFEGTGETTNSRNLRAVTSFKRLRATSWIVGVNTPVAEAYAPIERARWTLLVALVATILGVTVVVWRLMNLLTRPLLAFTAHVESVPGKAGSARSAAIASNDEIGQLAAAFNRMVADLDAKQAELEAERERLARAAHHWRATFDGIADGVCVLDGDLRVVRANGAMRALLGTGAEPVEGQPIDALLARVLGDAAGSDLVAGEGKALRQCGNRWLELRRDRIELPDGGGAAGYVQLVADVTHQQLLRERLAQSQKMAAVGQLAGGVAHDFNNILSVILPFSESLREELPDGEHRSGAVEIERAAKRATALTRQLLAFSRRQVVAPEVLSVRDVLRDVMGMIGRLIGEHISLTVDAGRTAGHVLMDPSLFEQVLVNLAVNARDAMPDSGKLTVEACDVEVSASLAPGRACLEAGPYVRIRVSDTGTGMDAATMARMYEPFFTTKPLGKGTGLGLAMVYAAIHQAGGTIEATSAPGAGATFTVHLPRVPAPEARPGGRASPRAPRGEEERVLLVEDDAQVRATLRRLLATGGYQVTVASNGEEALAAFRAAAHAFDLVVTELVMPGMGGIALGRALGELGPVPVLYISGYHEEVASGRAHLAPERFLPKPFDRETLLARVRAVLSAPG